MNVLAIRVATKWYRDHLKPTKHSVILVTNDKANMEKAKVDQLNARTSMHWTENECFIKKYIFETKLVLKFTNMLT